MLRRLAAAPLAVVDELVDQRLTATATVDEHVLELDQALEVLADLKGAPAAALGELAAGEAILRPLEPLLLAVVTHHAIELVEETSRLRRQLVEAVAEDLAGETVGELDVRELDLEDLDRLAPLIHGAPLRTLVLVQESDGFDEGQVLLVVATGAGLAIEKREPGSVGVDDGEWTQQTLSVAMQLEDLRAATQPSRPATRDCSVLDLERRRRPQSDQRRSTS